MQSKFAVDTKQKESQQQDDWNVIAAGWKKWDLQLMESLKPVGEKILAAGDIKLGDMVLDVATGSGEPGLSAASVVGKTGRVIGLDISEEMIKIAREKAQRLEIRNYEARVYAGKDLPFDSKSFDVVISRFGVMFFVDVAHGLKEMIRVLKDGRRLSISVWGPQNKIAKSVMQYLNEQLDLPSVSNDSLNPFRFSEEGKITSLLRDSGLREINQDEVVSRRNYPSASKYFEYILDTNPMINRSYNARDQLTREKLEAKVAELVNPIKDENGEINFNHVARVAYGSK